MGSEQATVLGDLDGVRDYPYPYHLAGEAVADPVGGPGKADRS